MRAPFHPRAGSVTLVALCFTTVLGIALGSYLALFQRAFDLGTRELHTDKARQLAQTGLEEALWALNQNTWSGSGPAGTSVWTTTGSDHTVTIAYGALDQGATGSVTITVANFAGTGPVWPTITSAATVTLEDGRSFRKTLSATTGPLPLFGNAIASARSYVRFYNGGTVDSWNSDPDNNSATAAVPYAFTAGNPENHAAVIAATDENNDYDGTNAVSINQAQVYGYLASAGKPVTYSSSGAPPGRVMGPVGAGVNVDPARIGKSAFIPAADEFTITPPPTSGPAYGGLISSVLDLVAALLGAAPSQEVFKYDGDLTITGFPLLSPSLTVDQPLKLIVDGDLTIGTSGLFNGKITVTPTGSLQIFVAGDVTIGGLGIVNQTNDPRKVAIFSTSTSTNSIQYTTGAAYTGVIYSENKPIDIRQNATFCGALLSGGYVCFSNSATAPVFHYDTALRTVRFSNVSTPYIITQLVES